jgi:hypothetical protein
MNFFNIWSKNKNRIKCGIMGFDDAYVAVILKSNNMNSTQPKDLGWVFLEREKASSTPL